ncbi:hypothetical protein BC830DRAFT_1121478 [Chytriomyces sp. MP71]|nr:hypothetical protein BC830DRAFT_1121478 [Chytriomyces sp. MP71]
MPTQQHKLIAHIIRLVSNNSLPRLPHHYSMTSSEASSPSSAYDDSVRFLSRRTSSRSISLVRPRKSSLCTDTAALPGSFPPSTPPQATYPQLGPRSASYNPNFQPRAHADAYRRPSALQLARDIEFHRRFLEYQVQLAHQGRGNREDESSTPVSDGKSVGLLFYENEEENGANPSTTVLEKLRSPLRKLSIF